MKKRLCILICLLFAALCMPAIAHAEPEIIVLEPQIYINPAYPQSEAYIRSLLEEKLAQEDGAGEVALLAGSPAKARGAKAPGSTPSFSTIEDAGLYLRQQMQGRNTSVVLEYVTSDKLTNAMVQAIYDASMEHDGVPTGGDYLAWQVGSYQAAASGYSYGADWHYEITFTLVYYDTAAQEAVLDARLAEVMDSLHLDGKSDYQKIRGIYDYIASNVVYDNENLNDSTYLLKYTAYAALIDGKAVCQGYANLLYRMLLEAGIDNRIITGKGYGGTDWEDHAWNIVKLEDRYYNLDATWDATVSSSLGVYDYFLKSPGDFPNHARYTTYLGDFETAYPMAGSSYYEYISTTIPVYYEQNALSVSYDAYGRMIGLKIKALETGYYNTVYAERIGGGTAAILFTGAETFAPLRQAYTGE